MKKILCLAAFAVALAVSPVAAEDDPQFLSFRTGAFDINDNYTTGLLGVEYRSDFRKFFLTPMAGGFVTAKGGLYGYGGVFVDLFLGRRLVLRPSFAVGACSASRRRGVRGAHGQHQAAACVVPARPRGSARAAGA